jgi:hypothetical protein
MAESRAFKTHLDSETIDSSVDGTGGLSLFGRTKRIKNVLDDLDKVLQIRDLSTVAGTIYDYLGFVRFHGGHWVKKKVNGVISGSVSMVLIA